jgi:hypothetical protein
VVGRGALADDEPELLAGRDVSDVVVEGRLLVREVDGTDVDKTEVMLVLLLVPLLVLTVPDDDVEDPESEELPLADRQVASPVPEICKVQSHENKELTN